MIKINVRTLFDITTTGVTGHLRSAHPSYTPETWMRARNQQRNWETLTQLIGLRTQIIDITKPVEEDSIWTFDFESESNVWDDGTDPVGVLKQDSNGVPMLCELDNDPNIEPVLVTSGALQNIWFAVMPINNILEN
jgi:hypothetical protein